MWVNLIIFIIATIIQVALAPKPPKPKPAALEDFDIPVAEEDRPVPVLFGKKLITGPNVVGYGDLQHEAIKKGGLFGSTTIGYRYYMGLHFALGNGPFNALTGITIGDKTAWTGNITANGSAVINQGNLFGGDKGEGGISGEFDVAFGEATQTPNAYLENVLNKHACPAYRGTFAVIWKTGTQRGPDQAFGGRTTIRSGLLGNTPYIKPWAFWCWRTTAGWQNNAPWYPEKATIGDTGMNAAHILYQLFTDKRWGEGSPADTLDDAKMRACADSLYDEGFALNLLWNNQTTIRDFATIVIEHIGGQVVFDRRTGKRYVKLIRGDYDANTLETFDESTISTMDKFQRRAWGETVNELTLSFTDPDTDKDTTVTIQDLANVRAQKARINQKISYSGITSLAVARTVCARELAARSAPLAVISFKINRKFWTYQQGSVFKLNWAQEGIAGVVFRVVDISGGTLTEGDITVDAVEDIFALTGLEYTEVQPTGTQPPPVSPIDSTPPNGASVISSSNTNPPIAPLDGDMYLVPAGAVDIWTGHDGEIAEWDASTGTYLYTKVPNGTPIYDNSTNTYVTVLNGVITPPPFGTGNVRAEDVSFDDSNTNLGADNVQKAIEAVLSQGSESAITVRAFVNGLYRAQTANLTLYDSVDGETYISRSTLGQTSLTQILAVGSGASVVYYAIKGNQVGKTATMGANAIYGAWDYVNVSPAGTPLIGLRYFDEVNTYVAWDGVGGVYVLRDGDTDWAAPGASTSYGSAIVPDAPTAWLRMGDDGAYYNDSGTNAFKCDFTPSSGGEAGTGISPNKPGLTGEGKAVECDGLTYVEYQDRGGGVVNVFQGLHDFSMDMWIKRAGALPTVESVLFSVNRLLATTGFMSSVQLQWDPVGKTLNLQTATLDPTGTFTTVDCDLTTLETGGITDIFGGDPHHIAITRKGSTGRACIYLDGILVAHQNAGTVSDLGSGASLAPAGTIWGNNYNKNAPYYGSILDELACYDTELSAARVLEHYRRGSDGVQAGFVVRDVFYDAPNLQWLIFGETQETVSADVIESRPKLYSSPDLIAFAVKSAIAETPATDFMQIQQVAWQHAADQAPSAAQHFLQRVFNDPDNLDTQAQYHFSFTYMAATVSVWVVPQSTNFKIAATPYFRGDLAALPIGYTSPTGRNFHMGVVRIGDIFYTSDDNGALAIDIVGATRTDEYSGLSEVYIARSPDGRLFATGHATGDPSSNFFVELDPADIATEIRRIPTTLRQRGGTGGLLSCDNNYAYVNASISNPNDGITRIHLVTGAESTIVLEMIAQEEKGYCTVLGDWIYRLWEFNRAGGGDCRVSRNKLSDGSADPDGYLVSGLAGDFLQGPQIDPPIWSEDFKFLCYNRKLLIDARSDATKADLVIYFQNIMAVALRKFNGGSDVAKFAYSSDGGASWNFPALAFPTQSPAFGIDGLVWNGFFFTISGKGWTAVSLDQPPTTFDFSDSGTSGIPETSRLVLYTGGTGRIVAAVRGDFGVRGSIYSDDGLIWHQGPEIKANASEINYDDSVTMYGHSDVQAVLEDVKVLIDALASPAAADITYDPPTGGLAATNVQDALDELHGDDVTIAASVTTVSGNLATFEGTKAQPGGLASLDGSGQLDPSQIPTAFLGAVDYKGTWNANTNSPDLPAASPLKGDYYVVSTSGATSLGGITDWKIGDWAIYNGSIWSKVDNTDSVTSVAGRTGTVVLASSDLSDLGAALGAAQLDAAGKVPLSEQSLLALIADATTARSVTTADLKKLTQFSNAAAIVLTINTNATTPIDVGEFAGYVQKGAGALSVAAAGGVTINVPSGRIAQARTTGSLIGIHKVGTNEWNLYGDLHT